MAEQRPRFRRDLGARPIEADGVTYIEVTDPRANRSFRLYQLEHAIAELLDGRPLEEVIAAAREQTGIELTSDQLDAFVVRLGELRFLDDAASPESAPAAARHEALAAKDDPPVFQPLPPPGPPPRPTPERTASARAAALDGEDPGKLTSAPREASGPHDRPAPPDEEALPPSARRRSPSSDMLATKELPAFLAEQDKVATAATPEPPAARAEPPRFSPPSAAPPRRPTPASTPVSAAPPRRPTPAAVPATSNGARQQRGAFPSIGESIADDVPLAGRPDQPRRGQDEPGTLPPRRRNSPSGAVFPLFPSTPPAPATTTTTTTAWQAAATPPPPVAAQLPDVFPAVLPAVFPALPSSEAPTAPSVTPTPTDVGGPLTRTSWKVYAVAGVGAALVIGGVIFGLSSSTKDRSVIEVRTVVPTTSSVYRWFDATGVVKRGGERVAHFPAGGKVTQVLGAGERFDAGDVLAELDSARRVKAERAHLEDRLAFYEKELEKNRASGDRPEARQAELKIAEKKRLIAEAQAAYAKLAIVATAPGQIAEPLTTVGAKVKAGAEAVRIKGTAWTAELELPREDADRLRHLGFCRAEIEGKPLDCSLAAEGGDETHVLIDLPEDPAVVAGKPVRVAKARYDGVFVLPASALVPTKGADRRVFVAKDGRAESYAVVLADQTPTEIVVTQGLEPGSAVVVDPPPNLSPRLPVRVVGN